MKIVEKLIEALENPDVLKVAKLSLTDQDILVLRSDDVDEDVVKAIKSLMKERGIVCAGILGMGADDDIAVVATDAQSVARAAENLAARLLEGVVKDLRAKALAMTFPANPATAINHALLAVADALETQRSILVNPIVAGLAKAMEDEEFFEETRREAAAERVLALKSGGG